MAFPMEAEPPLVVDLDGTLVRSDLLLETLLAAARRSPSTLLRLPFWLAGGRAALKRELASRASVPVATLPYRAEVLALVEEALRAGRRVVLATASDERVAREVARHVGFSDVVASDGTRNMKGQAKREALVARYGERGFDYVGDSPADVPVWTSARRAFVAGHAPGVLDAARRVAPEATRVPAVAAPPQPWLRVLRANQWPKNLLVLVPLLTAHAWNEPGAFAQAVVAFAAFCLVASAIYVANDLLDLPADRLHERKRRRPFAAGDVDLRWGFALVPLLLAASVALAALASGTGLALAIATYAIVALAYSLRAKQVVGVDVLVIAFLHTLRIVGGAAAVAVPVSHWLLAFSMFIFLSIALAKRHGELAKHLAQASPPGAVPGRGYVPADAPVVASLGTASGYMAVMVLALYINSETVAVLYSRPWLLWAIPVLVLYWVTRAWILTHRGTIAEDPLSFALRDPPSYAVAGLLVLCVLFAT